MDAAVDVFLFIPVFLFASLIISFPFGTFEWLVPGHSFIVFPKDDIHWTQGYWCRFTGIAIKGKDSTHPLSHRLSVSIKKAAPHTRHRFLCETTEFPYIPDQPDRNRSARFICSSCAAAHPNQACRTPGIQEVRSANRRSSGEPEPPAERLQEQRFPPQVQLPEPVQG